MSNLIYQRSFLSPSEKNELLAYLESLRPIWETRYSKSNPPPEGKSNRGLLRPVYWLGNWQFACLNYYHPPKGIDFRCVEAEPYIPLLSRIVERIEDQVRSQFPERDIPRNWQLNTCLINYYGQKLEGEKWNDVARVGEHKDFEPGPVASVSFGERALFQFVSSESKQGQSQVVKQMWLEDNSLQIFGGDQLKKRLFHRVQRVEKKTGQLFAKHIQNFQTRRINLTFRYVPREHIQPFNRFPEHLQADLEPYLKTLSQGSDFFQSALNSRI